MKTTQIILTILVILMISGSVMAAISTETFFDRPEVKKETLLLKVLENYTDSADNDTVKTRFVEKIKEHKVFEEKVLQIETNLDLNRFNRKDYTNASQKLPLDNHIIGNRIYEKFEKCEPYEENVTSFSGCKNYYNKYNVDNDAKNGRGVLIHTWEEQDFNSKTLDENTEIYKQSIKDVTTTIQKQITKDATIEIIK